MSRKYKHKKSDIEGLSFSPYKLGRELLRMVGIKRKVESLRLFQIACAFDICASYPEVFEEVPLKKIVSLFLEEGGEN